MTKAMEETLEIIGKAVADNRRRLFAHYASAMLTCDDARYAKWKKLNGLHDLDHESVMAMIRERMKSDSPLLLVNQMPAVKWSHAGAFIREARALLRERKGEAWAREGARLIHSMKVAAE